MKASVRVLGHLVSVFSRVLQRQRTIEWGYIYISQYKLKNWFMQLMRLRSVSMASWRAEGLMV